MEVIMPNLDGTGPLRKDRISGKRQGNCFANQNISIEEENLITGRFCENQNFGAKRRKRLRLRGKNIKQQ